LGQEDARFWNHIYSDSYDFTQGKRILRTNMRQANIVSADTDAVHLDTITKKDMVDFYAQYISTSSSKRSKLSVHLQAQSKPKEPTLDEKKASAIAALQVILTEHKIEPKTEELQTRINGTASADAFPETISTYLRCVLELKQAVAEKVLDEIKAALGVADSGLPAEPAVLSDTADVQSMTDASHPVIIKDIHAFKAGMQVSAGVRPVRNLEEFVEVAEKL
jgi:insulysin